MSDKPVAGTEDTVSETPSAKAAAEDDTLAGPTTQPRGRAGETSARTIGDELRGANIESFGQVPKARYEILGELARGGLGRVMRARDPRTGRIVALKEVIVPNNETLTRFAREALVTANLQHPAIVPVYEVGRWPNGEPFYAMKLVRGRTLTEIIAKTATPADRLALLPHAIAVADALAYAHSEHVIHRDLKPSNVLVGSYGETVVIDWGLARNIATGNDMGAMSNPDIDLGGETILGAVIGTPAYMPPEQAHGVLIDEAADVYAIGAMLYHMLSGTRPYADARSVDEIVQLVKTVPPRPLAELAPEAPRELIAIVEKAMARKLDDRYRSAEGLAEDLRRFQTGQLVGAHRYTAWQLVRRWIGRHRAILATSVVALVALAALGVISVRRIARERDEAEHQRVLAHEAEMLANDRYAASLEELAREALLAGGPERAVATLAGVERRTPVSEMIRGQATRAFAGLAGIAPPQDKHTLAAAITRDGARLAVASGEGKLTVWDVAAGKAAWTEPGLLLALAPEDAAILAAVGGEVTLRSMADGRSLGTWNLGEDVSALSWSADGAQFAVGGANGAIAIGSPGGALVPSEKHAKHVRVVSWGPTGALASVADDGDLIVRDAGKARHYPGAKGAVWSMAWIDPTHIVAGGEDHLARLWNLQSSTVEHTYDHGIDIYGVVAGAGWVATFGYGEHLNVWPLAGGPARELVGHRLGLNNGVAMGGTLITSDETGQVIAWDPLTGQRLRSLPYEGLLDGLVVRGDLLVTFGELRARIWRFDPDAIVRRLTGHTARIRDLVFAGDTLWTASNDGSVRSFALDGTPGRVLGTADFAEPLLTGPGDPNLAKPPNPHGARAVVIDGDRIATTYEDGRILMWKDGAQIASWTGHTGRVRSVVFAGPVAYSVGDTTVRRWDVATGKETAHGDLGAPAWAVAVHGDTVMTQTDVGQLALWDAATLAPGAKPAVGKLHLRDFAFVGDLLVVADEEQVGLLDLHTGKLAKSALQLITFSSDLGAKLIVTGDSHGEITIYDRDLVKLRNWRSGDDLVTAIRLRPDGKILATASARNVKIWDPDTGRLLAERTSFPTMITRIEWSPDGNHLAIAGGAPTVWLWDLAPAPALPACATALRLANGALGTAPPATAWCAPATK